MKKKKVFLHTDYSLAVTGFGKVCKYLCEYLYKTGKYDIVNFAVGTMDGTPDLERTPWKTIGAVNNQVVQNIKQANVPQAQEQIDRLAGYGAYGIDEAVKREKPDIVFSVQDIWGIDFTLTHYWASQIPIVLSTTLDSLPILPSAIEAAKKCKNFWSWADFATQAMRKVKGCEHVQTVRGPIDTSLFYRLPDSKRRELRTKLGIHQDCFIVGFVFRNQLRKSVPNLLEGFKLFQKENPRLNTKLLLHTHFGEGWNIHRMADEYGLDKNDIVTTYVCKACQEYEVKPFAGQDLVCKHCRTDKAQVTTQPGIGVSDSALNEVFNLMDVYCHPFTSGGQEIPIQQAKLTELITLVTNYSCGEDSCQPEAASLALDWAEYREAGTEFIKASTYPSSICKQLTKVLAMKPFQRREMGAKARQWVIDNFSIEKIGKFFEDFIDHLPDHEYHWEEKFTVQDPNYTPSNNENDAEWVEELYNNVLKRQSDAGGKQYWTQELAKIP